MSKGDKTNEDSRIIDAAKAWAVSTRIKNK